jgi:hypothetical protein
VCTYFKRTYLLRSVHITVVALYSCLGSHQEPEDNKDKTVNNPETKETRMDNPSKFAVYFIDFLYGRNGIIAPCLYRPIPHGAAGDKRASVQDSNRTSIWIHDIIQIIQLFVQTMLAQIAGRCSMLFYKRSMLFFFFFFFLKIILHLRKLTTRKLVN